MAQVRLRAVQHHRRALDAVAVLVQVGGDRRHARHAEVPRRDVVPEPLEERQHEAAETRIDVERHAGVRRDLRHLRDRVDHAERIVRRRPDDEHRVRRDHAVERRRHACAGRRRAASARTRDRAGAPPSRTPDAPSSARAAAPSRCPSPRACRSRAVFTAMKIDSVPPRRHRAAAVAVAVEQRDRYRDDLALHLRRLGKTSGFSAFSSSTSSGGGVQHRIDVRAGVVDQAPRARVVVVAVVDLQRAQALDHVLLRRSVLRQLSHGGLRRFMLDARAQG